MRYTFVVRPTIMYATFLGRPSTTSGSNAGSGNANFFYAITLVWSHGEPAGVGPDLCRAEGRVGGRATRDGGQGGAADIRLPGAYGGAMRDLCDTSATCTVNAR